MKILTLEECTQLYIKFINTVTDEKASIRKEALLTIQKLTKLLHEKFYIGREREWIELTEIIKLVEKLQVKLKADYVEFAMSMAGAGQDEERIRMQFGEKPDVMEMLEDISRLYELCGKIGANIKGNIELARQNFIAAIPSVIEALSALVGSATDSTNDILEVLRVLTYFKSTFPE